MQYKGPVHFSIDYDTGHSCDRGLISLPVPNAYPIFALLASIIHLLQLTKFQYSDREIDDDEGIVVVVVLVVFVVDKCLAVPLVALEKNWALRREAFLADQRHCP